MFYYIPSQSAFVGKHIIKKNQWRKFKH